MKNNLLLITAFLLLPLGLAAMQGKGKLTGADGEIKLMVLDPGHFHAALVQKTMYKQVSPLVHIYAPDGWDLEEHLKRVQSYNTRADNPTHWEQKIYRGPDFLQKMLSEKPGNVVVMAGNNQKKMEYIKAALDAGLNVLADKPMCIDQKGWEVLRTAFESAKKNNVLLYDIMTERNEITTVLQKELAHNYQVFGAFRAGTPDDPAVTKESVHHLFKYVSGKPLQRPVWALDVKQQGEGIVDVSTHLVDLVMWEVFPQQKINYKADIEMLRAKRWPTMVTKEQLTKVTGAADFPDYLKGQLNSDGVLPYFSNGEIIFKLRGIHSKVSVVWNFEAPQGAGDTHFSVMKGSRSNIVIRQGKEQNYRPELYIEPAAEVDATIFGDSVKRALEGLATAYPGLDVAQEGKNWRVVIPDKYRVGHEAHFGQVAEKFLGYLTRGKLPEWEVPNMIAKYYTTTKALEMAQTAAPQKTD
ncbi:MAG: oxidoreductase [Acidobacteria bacterium]|nr:MAG: oxidoreductase [Acidobacteriota bacterium]